MSGYDELRLVAMDEVALRNVLEPWRSSTPDAGVLALLPEAEAAGLPILQALCRQLDMPLVGAIFPALMTADGFIQHGVWLLRCSSMPHYFLLSDLNAANTAAERMAASLSSALESPRFQVAKPTLFLIFDGLLPNIASILEEVYLLLADRVEYAGANAGSETFQPMPCLFDADQVIDQGVLGLLWPEALGVVLEHGYVAPELFLTATSTEGNRIVSIDWRPAFEVYQALVKDSYGVMLDRTNFYQYGVHFPFGILSASGEILVRIPVGLNPDGSLSCVGEVPANSMLVLIQASDCASGVCVQQLSRDLFSRRPQLSGQGLVAFYCAGRRMHLGAAASADEAVELMAQTGVATLAGALSLGEIGSTCNGGYPLFHNAAIVSLPWCARA